MDPGRPDDDNDWHRRDNASFEDSERFEEDSQESLDESVDEHHNMWRGWMDCQTNCDAIQPGLSCVVYQYHNASARFSSASANNPLQGDPSVPANQHPMMSRGDNPSGSLLTLSEIAARVCAEKWSFQQLEECYMQICRTRSEQTGIFQPTTTIPEKIFLSFIVHCFPQSTDEIRMYSTLANGSNDQYEFGKTLYEFGHVQDVSQTGFLLSGNVKITAQDTRTEGFRDADSYHVTVKVDRCRIVECTCECSSKPTWCKHVVALCIYRIFERSKIEFKETIADAINSMSDADLRRLVQWHINEIPRKCIPGFQKLIDQIKDPNSYINTTAGAPDPTDGGHDPVSRFDFPEIEKKVRKLLCRYCVPSPAVLCDVSYLSNTPHPTHAEWTTVMKPFRCREPEGMWNLLQMVREMFARNDENSVALLRTITDECLANNQVLLWWYISKLVESGHWMNTTTFKVPMPQQLLVQLNCAQLCDEVVTLWKLVAMNPRAGNAYRTHLAGYLQDYHRTAVNRVKNTIGLVPLVLDDLDPRPQADATVLSSHQTATILQTVLNVDVRYPLSAQNMKFSLNCFPGFYPAIQMCHYLNEQDIRLGHSSDAIFYVSAPNLRHSYRLVPPAKEKILKKKKKKKKLMKKRGEEGGFGGRRDGEYQGLDGIWRAMPDVHNPNDRMNDSTESGQESDIQKVPQRLELPKKKKMDSVEMDVNEVLAAAFTPLDTIEARFLRAEAYGSHGYRAEAVEYSLRIVDYLIDSLTEQSNEFCQTEQRENVPSTSKQSSSSSSDEVSAADREEEVACSNRFLSTMEKILYITKVLKDSPHLQCTVFDIALRTLSVTKYPFFTKHQQILFAYFDMEFVAILEQLWQSVPMGEDQMRKIRSKAENIIATHAGNNGELPPIALTKFLFLALYWTEELGQNVRPGQNGPAAASPVLQENRRLLLPTDADLALHCALNILGCRPLIPDKYLIHGETIRREKSELACMLLTRYKDSQEKCALVMDRLLDPKLHRIYPHHMSNASYFLRDLDPRRFKPGQRPVFPYEDEQVEVEEPVEKEDPIGEYEAMLEAHMETLVATNDDPDRISYERKSEEEAQSSSPSENESSNNNGSGPSTSRSDEIVDDSSSARTLGLTKEIRDTVDSLHIVDPTKNTVRKKKRGHTLFDPRNVVTDAHVYHMFELAKKIVNEAGGQQNNIMWGNPVVGNTNRRLHMCAIIIGIYSLGMSNRISPSWNTRTYSCIGSWVSSQVQEVGATGVEVIREVWMAHFTPNEVAGIADRSSPSSDTATRLEAAKLALSVLPFAHALTDDEVINVMSRCRAESREILISGLHAMDTPQFRQIGRARPLYAAMHHWHDLSYELNQQAAQPPPLPPPPPPPAGMVANPYAMIFQNALLIQQQQQRQLLQQQQAVQAPAQNNPQGPNAPAPQVQVPVANPAQFAHLYPQVYEHFGSTPPIASTSYRAEYAQRLHQSHSAPQLGGSRRNDHLGVRMPMANQQHIPQQPNAQPSPANSLMNAFYYGMRAMDCMSTSPGEEKNLYLKFGSHPPYLEDLTVLYNVSKQLGGNYLVSYLSNASRTVLSPYILHQYASESLQLFPRAYAQNPAQPVRMPSGPVPLMQQNVTPPPQNIRYPTVKFSMPGQITSLFITNGYQQITGELFERCCEQYLQAIINKMSSPRVDPSEVNEFVRGAHEAFQWIPKIGFKLFDDFVRVFKRQKGYRKELASNINMLLLQLNH